MKQFTTGKCLLATILVTLLSLCSFAQSHVIPELVFRNPVVISGTPGTDGAVYRFSKVTAGIDALVKIKRRSSASVVLTDMDVTSSGWDKAFQPQLGIPGDVAANQNWWMEFEMRFVYEATTKKKKVKRFAVTALDVDGDNVSIREFVQMDKVETVSFFPETQLASTLPLSLPLMSEDDEDNDHENGYNKIGVAKRSQGPVQTFPNIDTSATSVMATYHYEDKDVITFVIGAHSGTRVSNDGERLNSLWFKTFSLEPFKILPVKLTAFTARLNGKKVQLDWSTGGEEAFSHFVVERSTDGTAYSDLALHFANGNTMAVQDYRYSDANPVAASVLYYRLRMTDKDGSFTYSDVRLIRTGKEEGGTALLIFPNPATADLYVTLPAAWQGQKVTVSLFGGNGSRVLQQAAGSASQTEKINIRALPRGVYVVQVAGEAGIVQQQVIKN